MRAANRGCLTTINKPYPSIIINIMKKLTNILIPGIFLITLFTQTAYASFSDVASTHANYDAIEYVQDEGIVEGYPDGTYKPDQTINRAEFTKIIMEAITYDEITDYFDCYPDVSDNDWFRKYVCLADKKGVVDGYPDGLFRPANSINFVEAAKIIVEGFEYQYSYDENWFLPYIGALEARRAIPTTIQSFEHDITRGEMAEIIYRLKDYVSDKESLTYRGLKEMVTGEESEYATYEQWTLPGPWNNGSVFAYETDCVGLWNGETYGGDLLSTMIVDDGARSVMNLKLYTPEYVYNLENKIVDMTHEDYSADLYAFKVCHLGPELDVVAGGTWPMGESNIIQDGKFKGEIDFDFPEEALLIIVNGDEILTYDDIKLIDNTATGAESAPCSAKLEDEDTVLWSCFMGLHAEDGYVTGSDMKYWSIPLDGSEPTVWEDTEYLDAEG